MYPWRFVDRQLGFISVVTRDDDHELAFSQTLDLV